MRRYVWYSPELNVIVFQSIMENCYISFEWDYSDMVDVYMDLGSDIEPIQEFLWLPLGEL